MIHKETPLQDVLHLTPPCRCAQCEHGCAFGSGAFAKGEEQQAAQKLAMPVEKFRAEYLEEIEKFNTKLWRPKSKKPYGACIFFDKRQGCTIHEVKPLECKTAMGCSPQGEALSLWFTVNHFLNPFDPESVRQYAAYLASGGKALPGATLQDIVKDPKLLQRILSFEIMK